ncbi:hypothetical protein NQ314_002092 [Rhamnusium bicolor]|uniref:Uncharacterized protein n=1 Tax=Rhamnusium bicolor TaxID=1586634 RepID=A0AAV8ZR91_9CUCU|nr:hypothetical protein NQ314_002092 [Rhamnusium bicolor]
MKFNISRYKEFSLDLAQWAIEENIHQSSLKKLLQIINKTFPDVKLPKDPRTLLKTPNLLLEVVEVDGGDYYYFGIEKTINMLCKKYNVTVLDNDEVKLAVNIDGLPLSKSSSSAFWPVLCLIKSIKKLEDKVFVVALYHGSEKSKHPNILLQDFVSECTLLTENKICINNIKCTFRIEMLICDTPAKSCLKNKRPFRIFFMYKM